MINPLSVTKAISRRRFRNCAGVTAGIRRTAIIHPFTRHDRIGLPSQRGGRLKRILNIRRARSRARRASAVAAGATSTRRNRLLEKATRRPRVGKRSWFSECQATAAAPPDSAQRQHVRAVSQRTAHVPAPRPVGRRYPAGFSPAAGDVAGVQGVIKRITTGLHAAQLGAPEHLIDQRTARPGRVRRAEKRLNQAGDGGAPRPRHRLGAGVHLGVQGDGDTVFIRMYRKDTAYILSSWEPAAPGCTALLRLRTPARFPADLADAPWWGTSGALAPHELHPTPWTPSLFQVLLPGAADLVSFDSSPAYPPHFGTLFVPLRMWYHAL